MVNVQEIFGVDLAHWIAGVRFFGTDDGRFFIIDSDVADYPSGRNLIFVRRETSVLFCNADGSVTDLIPDHMFPPGTTCAEAIAEIGFNLIDETTGSVNT
jgi:hypothetical protein